jgi:hypothetical protein
VLAVAVNLLAADDQPRLGHEVHRPSRSLEGALQRKKRHVGPPRAHRLDRVGQRGVSLEQRPAAPHSVARLRRDLPRAPLDAEERDPERHGVQLEEMALLLRDRHLDDQPVQTLRLMRVEPELGGRLAGAPEHHGLPHRIAQRHRGGDLGPGGLLSQQLALPEESQERAIQGLDGLADAGEIGVLVVHEERRVSHSPVPAREPFPCVHRATARAPTGQRPSGASAMSRAMENTRTLAQVDPEIAALIRKETERQEEGLELIASENFVSPAVLEAMGSVLTNKYAEGYPGKRYYGGCEVVDQVETLAIERAKKLFGAEAANVQAHSGSQANMAAYMSVMQPGDTMLSLDLNSGGHLTHGMSLNFSGKLYRVVHYGLDRATERIDFGQVRSLAKEHRRRSSWSAPPPTRGRWTSHLPRDRRLRRGPSWWWTWRTSQGSLLRASTPSPVPLAELVTTTTHKTLRGPRAGWSWRRSRSSRA